ncbi:unnamed protein product [Bursaphelenchus xylophilus]|uniref:(pine wood nematode) hypothetical protein n=1 Tax=Bursaphelenchus xylophilus TaxID=6326 RepID=A0A7I8XIP6_BURXY|nr:unnamed protein product [Bursaphelenchus xylophilus]CAG9085689.1 unnamed protein product [Bursaphelenchus xylophilus]
MGEWRGNKRMGEENNMGPRRQLLGADMRRRLSRPGLVQNRLRFLGRRLAKHRTHRPERIDHQRLSALFSADFHATAACRLFLRSVARGCVDVVAIYGDATTSRHPSPLLNGLLPQ